MKKFFHLLLILALAVVLTKLSFSQRASVNNSSNATSASVVEPQSQPAAPRWVNVIELNMKPGALNDYMAFRVKERIPALKKAGYKHQEVWVSSVGPRSKVFVVEPLDDLSLFDQNPSRIVKAIGAEANQALLTKGREYIASGSNFYLLRTLPDLSWTSQMTAPAKYAIVARLNIARGRLTDFENYIKNDYLPIVKKSGALGYTVSRVAYGGNPMEYVTLTFFNSFSEIEKNDPARSSVVNRIPGVQAQSGLSKIAGVIIDTERNIIQFRPEWSIMP